MVYRHQDGGTPIAWSKETICNAFDCAQEACAHDVDLHGDPDIPALQYMQPLPGRLPVESCRAAMPRHAVYLRISSSRWVRLAIPVPGRASITGKSAASAASNSPLSKSTTPMLTAATA
jgi:hypothetical protein